MSAPTPDPRRRSSASALFARIASLEWPVALPRTPGLWLWVALAIGVGARVFLVLFTDGTYDVPIWQSHGGWVSEYGLVGYYARMEVFNHPPFIGKVLSLAWEFGRHADIPFRVLLRAPFALIDLGNALLLLRLFRDSPYRYLVAAVYWIHPLAMIFSAYHGNTDTAVAFFMLLGVAAASRGNPLGAGIAVGVGLWIKIPVILAAPAIFFFFPDWRRRLVFLGVTAVVGASTYLPVLVQAPALLYERVIAYSGLHSSTPGGLSVWGIWNAFGIVNALPEGWGPAVGRVIDAHADHNTLVAVLPIFAFAWLRRGETTARGLGATVCGSLILFYALTTFWAFQYLAWSLPFWLFAGPRFFAAATVAIGGYVYGLYAVLCDSPFLLGRWDFRGHPYWPEPIVFLRDASLLVCLVSAVAFLAVAVRGEWMRSRAVRATRDSP